MKDKDLLEWAHFVATKFESSRTGWVYSRDLGGLKHMRYESDSTGWNHWTKRVRRAANWKRLTGVSRLRRGQRPKQSLRNRLIFAFVLARNTLQKDDNLPDGQINGIPTNWEEDGEYIAIFQPRVGVKVLDFIKAEPDNPYAKAILAEMHTCVELSWPSNNDENKKE